MSSNRTIVDRVVERLKAQPLGDLITEEDLHDIVKEAIPKAFFQKRVLPNRTGYGTEEKDPLIIEVMRDLLKDSAKEAVDKWLTDNPEIVIEYWKKVCDDKLLTYVNNIMDERATATVRASLRGMIDNMNAERSRAGMPLIGTYF